MSLALAGALVGCTPATGGGGGGIDFTPDTTDLAVWLEADAIEGLSDGDPVASWPNTGAYGALAASGDDRPAWIADALNGHPVVDGEGSSLLAGSGAFRESNTNFTAFLVTALAPTSDTYKVVVGTRQGSGGEWNWWYPFDNSIDMRLRTTANDSGSVPWAGDLADDTFRVFGVRYDESVFNTTPRDYDSLRGYVGVTEEHSLNASVAGSSHQLAMFGQVGSSSFRTTAKVAAFVWYDRMLSDAEYEEWVDYFAQKYGAVSE